MRWTSLSPPPVKPCALSPAHLDISPFSIQSKALSALVWIKELLGIPSESILYVCLGRVCERVHIFVMPGFHSLNGKPLNGIAHDAAILMLMCAQTFDHFYLRSKKKGGNHLCVCVYEMFSCFSFLWHSYKTVHIDFSSTHMSP